MKRLTALLAGGALVAGLAVVAPATVAPVPTASAASCTTTWMSYYYPNYYRVTLKTTGTRYYFNTFYKADQFLKTRKLAGSIHKIVGTVTATGSCVDHWQWQATRNYYVSV